MSEKAKKFVVDDSKGRGVMTYELAKKGESILGHPLTVVELLLIPYVHYCAVSRQSTDRSRTNTEEHEILRGWTDRGLCRCFPFNVKVAPSNDFWQFMCDVLFDAYVLQLHEVTETERASSSENAS